jgi:hypothetical protein
MIAVGKIRATWLARYKVDFRKGHWTLLSEAYGLGLDPLQGDLILFISRDKRKLKLLYIDGTGIWLSHKLFFNGAMKSIVDFEDKPCKAAIGSAELAMLLEGASFTIHKRIADFTVKD